MQPDAFVIGPSSSTSASASIASCSMPDVKMRSFDSVAQLVAYDKAHPLAPGAERGVAYVRLASTHEAYAPALAKVASRRLAMLFVPHDLRHTDASFSFVRKALPALVFIYVIKDEDTLLRT